MACNSDCEGVCCVVGTTATPDTSDACVCNAGIGATFVGSGGAIYIRTAMSSPCDAGDWEELCSICGGNDPVTALSTPTIDMVAVNGQISGEVIISPDVNNCLEERANGLYVPRVTVIQANNLVSNNDQPGPYTNPGGAPNSARYDIITETFVIANPDPTRVMNVSINSEGTLLLGGLGGLNRNVNMHHEMWINGSIVDRELEQSEVNANSTETGMGVGCNHSFGIPVGGSVTVDLIVGFNLFSDASVDNVAISRIKWTWQGIFIG